MEGKSLPNEFQMMDVEKICALKRTRLQTWMERGWIIPSIQKATGYGTRNVFSRMDLYRIMLFKHMIDGGLTRETAAEYIKSMSDYTPDWPLRVIIFTRAGEKVKESQVCVSETLHSTISESEGVISESRFLAPLEWDPDHFPNDSEDWDDVYIVNFRKVKESVDKKSR